MSFKNHLISLIPLTFVVLASTGCGKLINEAPPKTVNEAKLGFETGCLSNALPIMKNFMNGDAQPEEVAGVWTCFGNALDAFQNKVKGGTVNEYTSQELTRFFEDRFFENTKINDRLLLEIMHIKQIFVGGRDDLLTREELTKLILFSNKMKGISLRLLPYMKVFTMGWKISGYRHLEYDVKHFEDANEAIQDAAKEIASMIEKNDRGYQLDNFVILLEEMSALYGETWSFIPKVQKVMPLVQKLKSTLAGGQDAIIAPNEWRRFALLGARGYIQYLRYFYFIQGIDESIGGPHLIYFTNSVQDLFSYLGDMVRTKPGEKFTKAELLEVLQALQRIFPELNVSDAFITELMKVKTLVFGGSQTEWVPEDFDNAKSKVHAVRSLIERVWSHVHFYTLKWNPQDLNEEQGQAYFRRAEANLLDVSRILSTIFESSYNLNDILPLVRELEKVFPPQRDKKKTLTAIVERYLPLVITYKNVLLTDENPTVQKEHWNDFLDISLRLYLRVLYYQYFMAPRTLSQGDGLNSLHQFVFDSADVLDLILARKGKRSQNFISFSELDKLALNMSQAEIFPQDWKVSSIENLVRVVFKRLLTEPEKRLQGIEVKGFEPNALIVFKQEFNLWYQNQKLIEEIFGRNRQGITSEELQKTLEKLDQTIGVYELRQIFNTSIPMTFDVEGRLHISTSQVPYNYDSLIKANLSRGLVRMIIRSYSMDLGRIQNYQGINLKEANMILAEVGPFFVDIGMLAPDNKTFAESRFSEANLFTAQGDGGELMDFREGSHLVLMILSGMSINNTVMKDIEKCPMTEAKLQMDRQVDMSCYLQVYRKAIPVAFASLPELSFYVSNLSDNEFSLVMINLLKATGWKSNDKGLIPLSDLGLVPHVLQYLENLMVRFDQSQDGVLQQPEALAAYPLFAKMLKTVSLLKSDRLNRAAFAYVLRYGKAPTKMKEKIHFITVWVMREKRWNINANRTRIANVFGYIADEVAKKNKEGFAPPGSENHVEVITE